MFHQDLPPTIPLTELFISLDSPIEDVALVDARNIRVFDALEYGLGFPRGYLDGFINSGANHMSLRADLWEAFKAMKWGLVPDLDHLKYITGVWQHNRRCALDKRKQYVLPRGEKTESGLMQYPYRLFYAKDLHVCGPAKMSIENGATYVWSTIPPYLHMVFAKEFMMRHNEDVPLSYVYYKGSLCTYHILMGMLIPRAFVTPLPHADRPAPRCIEDEEELERAVLRKRAAKMKKALERAGV